MKSVNSVMNISSVSLRGNKNGALSSAPVRITMIGCTQVRATSKTPAQMINIPSQRIGETYSCSKVAEAIVIKI